MHVPDHMLSDPTSVATGAVACATLAYAAYRSRSDLTTRTVALTAATGALVFALQMVNYPVASGTSGHLMGGALAAALLGPWLGMISVTLVLVVQAVLFADGGLTALGTNTLLMAVVGTAVGWLVARAVQRVRAGSSPDARSAALAAGAGALVSVPASALAFVGLFLAGGSAAVPAAELTAGMVGVHALIGLGEGLVTALVVAVVVAVAPGVARLDARPVTSAGTLSAHRRAVGAISAGAALSAVGLSSFAASAPDGLEATAESLGFLDTAGLHALAGSPLADYGASAGIFVGLAGALGVLAVAVLSGALLAVRNVRGAPAR